MVGVAQHDGACPDPAVGQPKQFLGRDRRGVTEGAVPQQHPRVTQLGGERIGAVVAGAEGRTQPRPCGDAEGLGNPFFVAIDLGADSGVRQTA